MERHMQVKFVSSLTVVCLASLVLQATCGAAPAAEKKSGAPEKVSYYKQIRPIFQANCQGCHQPAKAKGGYVMTDFARLLAGGEECAKDGSKAVVPRDPDKSLLIHQITPDKGEAEMPPKKEPLHEFEIQVIRKWI